MNEELEMSEGFSRLRSINHLEIPKIIVWGMSEDKVCTFIGINI